MELYILASVLLAGLSIALIRFAPYFLFRQKSAILDYLNATAPLLIITLLVIFTLKDIDFSASLSSQNSGFWAGFWQFLHIGGVSQGISLLLLFLVFHLFRNAMLAMFAGIICYLLLVNVA